MNLKSASNCNSMETKVLHKQRHQTARSSVSKINDTPHENFCFLVGLETENGEKIKCHFVFLSTLHCYNCLLSSLKKERQFAYRWHISQGKRSFICLDIVIFVYNPNNGNSALNDAEYMWRKKLDGI